LKTYENGEIKMEKNDMISAVFLVKVEVKKVEGYLVSLINYI